MADNKLIVVDPNPKDNELVPLENLTISVELETISKGRSILTTQGSIINNQGKAKVNFINGSPVDGRNSLTTNYSEVNTKFNTENKDLENLGITNIDIDFDASYTPMVKIDFIDIRGNSILEHGQDSSYNVFFELPYPIFKLTIKGYYGKAVSYCLHLRKWNARFNSNSGNFEISCEFIGYTYAFFSDMLLGYLKGIVETTKGKKRLKEKGMITISELLQKTAELDLNNAKLKESTTVKESILIDRLLLKISEIRETLNNFIKGYEDINDSVNVLYNNIENIPEDILGLYIVTYTDNDTIEKYDSTFNINFTDKIKEFNKESGAYSLSESLFIMDGDIKTYKNFIHYENNKPIAFATDGKTVIPIETLTSTEVAKSLVSIGSTMESTTLIKVYNLNETITQLKTVESQLKTKKEELKLEITDEIKKNITETYGNGFEPNIYNIFNIILAHVEVFMECLTELGEEAENAHKTDALKVKAFKSIDTNKTDPIIYPFPKYYDEASAQEKWIGNEFPTIPEVKFINDLLAGMIAAVKKETDLMNIITNSRNWYPVNILDRTYSDNSVNPYVKLDKDAGLPLDFIRLITLRAVAFLTVGNTSYTNNELTAMANLEANNVFTSITNKNTKGNITTLTKETLLKNITEGTEYYKNSLSTDGIILKPIAAVASQDITNSTGTAGVSTTTTIAGTAASYSYNYLISNSLINLPLGGTNFSFKGENIVNNLYDNNNNTISVSYNGLFKLIKKEDYFNNEPFPSYGDKIIGEIKDNPNYDLFKGTFRYTEKIIDNSKPFFYNFYHNFDNEKSYQGILTNNKILSSENYNIFNAKIKLKDLYPLLEKGKELDVKNTGGNSDNFQIGFYNEFFYETSKLGSFKNNLIESITKDIHIEDIVFGNRGSSGPASGSYTKTSLFGSEFYYRQESEEAKAFLFLNSIGFINNVYDNKIRNSVYAYFNNAGYVSAPKAWIYYIGSILWRMNKQYDPIIFISNSIGSNVLLVTDDYKEEIKNMLAINNTYRLLYQNNYYGTGDEIYPPKKDELFSSEGVLLSDDDLMCFTDGEYAKVDNFIKNFPDDMRKIFIKEFTDWVKGDWLKFKQELELFDSTINFNNSKLWDTNWENFKDVPTTNTDISYKNFNHENYYILRKTYRTINGDSVYTANKNLSRNYMLSFAEDTEIVKNILSFLKEEIIIQNGTPKLWGDKTRDFSVDKVSFDKYIDTFLGQIAALKKDEITKNNDEEEKNELEEIIGNDDIKLNLYRSIKAIYDKWIGGDNVSGCIRRDNLISTFKFLNKSFADIGKDFLVNPQSITNYIEGFSNRSTADVFSKILADNNFDFIALPSFVDFKEEKELKSMFETHDVGEAPTVGPAFICMYANRANTLDLGYKGTTGDSGFNINANGTATLSDGNSAFHDTGKNETIAAFLVKYGDDNQSIFKDIRLDQKEFSETDESLIIIDKMANTKEPGAKTNIGQNLFNMFSTRSYSCEIESLGNAMIQPMMYFQLTNIPMFRGAYLIIRASHNIKPNHMTTTFKGVRIAGIDVPLITSETISLGVYSQFSGVDTSGVVLSKTEIPESAKDTPPEDVNDLNFGNPLKGTLVIKSRYGPRKLNGNKYHYGTDFAVAYGTDVIAIADGFISDIAIGKSPDYGLSVIITHTDLNNRRYRTLYGHLSDINKEILDLDKLTPEEINKLISKNYRVNYEIKKGKVFGKSGGTPGKRFISNIDLAGGTTGAHLHFEIRVEETTDGKFSKGDVRNIFYNGSVKKDPLTLIEVGVKANGGFTSTQKDSH